MLRRLEDFIHKVGRWNRRRRVKRLDFSVLSNNCWAGLAIYQRLGLRYTTPTIGLIIHTEDYIRFLENLDYYLACRLEFINRDESQYQSRFGKNSDYPIAKLDDIELHFVHYTSQNEAEEKWNRRVKLLNRNRLLVKMSLRENDVDFADIIRRFKNLPYKNKILFSPVEDGADGETVIYVPEL